MTSAERETVVDLLLEARRALSMQRSDFAALSEDRLLTLHETLEKLVDQLGAALPGATPPGRIEEFFGQVGEGMIRAQSELDRESAAYNAARMGAALPTAYRIPKVSAEIGFTMARKRESGFSVFALGRSQSGENTHTNKVTFDIVAAPPPALEAEPSPARFIVNAADRQVVATALGDAACTDELSRECAGALLRAFKQVIVLRAGTCVLFALPGDDGTLLFGVLNEGTGRFESHGPLPDALRRQGRWLQLVSILARIKAAQDELIPQT